MLHKSTLMAAASVFALSLASPVGAQVVAPVTAEPAPAARSDSATSATPGRNRVANNGDIIVTARKREERLIDVPLTITAFNQEAIQKAGIESVADLAMQTPGFSFRQGFGRSGSGSANASARPVIRGMSNILGGANAGFFVDGIFVYGNVTSYQLDNLERVEVIKGPQAALFGRQTFAGAINFVTRKPGNEFGGRINLTLGQYNHREASGYVTVPLVRDVLSAEINARSYYFGGDYINQDSGKRDINRQRTTSFGGKIRLFPGNNFEAIANVIYSEDRDAGFSAFLMKNTSQQLNCFLPRITTNIPFPTSSTRSRGYFCGEIESPRTFAYNNDELEALGFNGVNRTALRTSLALEYETDSGWIMTSITAHNRSKNQNGFDNSYVPRPFNPTNPALFPSLTIDGLKSQDFSQEVRIQTPRGKRFRALAGAYFYKASDGQGFSVQTGRANVNFGRRSGYNSLDEDLNKAVYGMVEADFTDRFTMTAEARYQRDRVTGSNEISVLEGVGQPLTVRRTTFNAFLPRVTARYELNPRWNLYGSVAKGNKPGGFNDLPTDAVPATLTEFLARGIDTYNEEDVWSYELGTKGRFGRFFVTLAAYRLDWSNQQLTQSQPYQRTNGTFTTLPFLTNAGKSRIKGIEFDVSGPLTRWLNVRLGYAYNDARFVDFYDENTEELLDTDGRSSFLNPGVFTIPNPADVDGPNGQVRGNRLPQTPVHQLILSGDAHFPVAAGTEFFFRADLAYDTKRFVQVHNLAHTGDSYNLNLRTGIERGPLTLTVFMNNALDDRTPLVGTRLFDFTRLLRVPAFPSGFRTTFFRDFLVSSPRRRQIGVTMNYKF